jgi:hypothetical protein
MIPITKKSVIRGLTVGLVIVLLLILLLRSRSPFGKDNSSFASKPDQEITKIELSDNGKKLVLEERGENWLINGKSETRKSGVMFLLRVLKEIKIKSPVSVDLFNTEITSKNLSPVKVKVYENRRLLKTFLVYKTRSNGYGNFMKLKESSKPFIVYVPGYEGDIGSAFIVNELYWQPYVVFNLLPSEIASVNFENFIDTTSSFKISNKSQHYSLSYSQGNLNGWDSSLLARYITYFARVPFESWAFGTAEAKKKPDESDQPLYRITVVTTQGRKNVLTLWPLMKEKPGAKVMDSDRLLGKTDENDEFFIMRYFDIDPLIKKRSYFFPK